MTFSSNLRVLDRQRELLAATKVANAINVRDKLDLYVVPGRGEPEDAALLSKSNPAMSYSVQVVSTPGTPIIRHDHKNYRKYEQALAKELQAAGINSGQFTVFWCDNAIRYGLKRSLIRALANLIAHRVYGRDDLVSIDAVREYEEHRWMSEVAHHVHALRLPELTRVSVTSPSANWLPQDGTWITEAVDRKIKKYGATVCSRVTLIVDGGTYIDREQVAAYEQEFTPHYCPFEHLWVIATNTPLQIK